MKNNENYIQVTLRGPTNKTWEQRDIAMISIDLADKINNSKIIDYCSTVAIINFNNELYDENVRPVCDINIKNIKDFLEVNSKFVIEDQPKAKISSRIENGNELILTISLSNKSIMDSKFKEIAENLAIKEDGEFYKTFVGKSINKMTDFFLDEKDKKNFIKETIIEETEAVLAKIKHFSHAIFCACCYPLISDIKTDGIDFSNISIDIKSFSDGAQIKFIDNRENGAGKMKIYA